MKAKSEPLAPTSSSIALACYSDPNLAGNLYTEVILHQFRGDVDDERMQRAFQAIVDRHDALRTVLKLELNEINAIIHPPGSIIANLEVLNLVEYDIDSPQVQDALNEVARRRFDLGRKPPLVRMAVVRANDHHHILLLCYNHCIMDGGSQGVWFRELAALYNGESLPPLEHQYSDFSSWEHDFLIAQGSEIVTNQLEYWKKALYQAPETLKLPGDCSRPPMCSFLGRMITFSIPDDLRSALLEFMASERQSLLRIMLAAYAITLSKYSQQNEVVIAVPRSVRRSGVDDAVIGNFVNILPVRLQVNDDTPFKEAVKGAGQVLKEAVSNGDVPFESIVNACCSGRDAAYSPIAQALITVHDQDWFTAPALEGLVSEPCSIPVDTGRCINDITLRVFPGDDVMNCQLLFNTEVFSEKNVARLVDSFLHVLRNGVEKPEAPSTVILGPEHRKELQTFSMGVQRPHYLEQPLAHEAFEAIALKSPQRKCLCFEGEWLSYGEVDNRASILSGKLSSLGVGPGVVVGVMLDRSFELVVSMLAVLKAGGCFVPCDPSYPDDRLSIYLEVGKAVVVLAEAQYIDRATSMVASDVSVLNVDDFSSLAANGVTIDETNLKIKNRGTLSDPAYIIFTSGSTGTPKGVVIDHAALVDFLAYNLEYYSVDEDCISVLSITINFDPCIMQIFTPLVVGGGLVIARPGGHIDADYIANLLVKYSVTFFNTVPSLGLEYYRRSVLKNCTCLKSAIFSGEAMPMELVHLIHKNVPKGVRVYNAYGPTEATVMATNLECPADLSYMTIGFPENNMQCYIVDSQLRPVPVGVPGELLLSGPRLAVGYAHRPELTAEKFIPNPCLDLVRDKIAPSLAQYYQKAYRTGDLVKWRSDGSIDFMGRIDRQTKINGVRVELGEVEAALESCKGVIHAVASAVVDHLGQKRLVGYVTPGHIDNSVVMMHCQSILVPAMVPSVVISMDVFPLLLNGKVDVKNLPAPDWSGVKSSEEYVAPDGEIEIMAQKVFAEVLGRPAKELSVLADFFAAGGTSLQVFRATAMLQESFEVENIPIVMIHIERSVRRVAAALEKLLASQNGSKEDSRPKDSVSLKRNVWPDSMRPLSFNQNQMWLASSLGGSSAYNMHSALETEVPPDVAALTTALNAVAARHEVLRTRFHRQKDGTVTGVAIPVAEFQVPLRVVEVQSQEEEVHLVREEAVAAFDLESEPLLRVVLLLRQQPRSGAVLVVTMHHVVADAWSLDIFWKELSEAYAAALSASAPSWPALPIQYADYAVWQRKMLADNAGVALRAFWKENLAGVPSMLQLPQDRPRPANPTNIAGSFSTVLPAGMLQHIQSLAQHVHVNVQSVLLAALQLVLLRYSGQDDLVVGVPVAGRDRQETHGLIGYFINTLPVRCFASKDASFEDMVANASKATLAALEHSLLPLEDVVAVSGVARVPNANPLFQVLFQYLPEDYSSAGKPVCTLGSSEFKQFGSPGGLAHAKMDLTFTMIGEAVTLDYMSEIFDNKTIKRIYGSCISVLEHSIIDHTVQTVAIDILDGSQVEAVAAFSIGDERPEYLNSPLVHEIMAQIAFESPQRKCLYYEGEWLSYGEVDSRASVLAGKLSSLGVGPGVVVGLMLDRSFELVISIIAVFKAGGVYLPCDPSYPDDRLKVYVEDATAVVVLTVTEYAARARAMAPSSVSVIDLYAADGPSSKEEAVPVRSPGPVDPAYIIFTSGSTGRPKGVMVPHRAILDHVLETAELYSMGSEDAGVLTITINFDPHLMQALTPLVVGAGLVIAKPDAHADGDYVTGLISQQHVTHFVSTPSLALVQFQGKYAKDCAALRFVMFGGEQLPREVITLFEDKIPTCRVYNVYGPTEATITATALYCPPSVEFISIGRPVYNLHCYIVDSELRPVPVGVPGELLLSGPRLALGYVGRPDLTEEKFIPNPCIHLVAGRVDLDLAPYYEKAYRTGDLVRWRNDGTIDFLGRIDRQVKITGVRIELGEVEGALESTPGVTQSVATALPDASGQKRLVGYVTPATVEPAAVIAHCRTMLVPAMVPSIVVALESFPLLPGGKIDVKALPAPDWSGAGEEEYVAPADETEAAVQRVFADVLRRSADELSVHSDFFSIGGTSLQAMQISTFLMNVLGVHVAANEILRAPTVRQVALIIKEKKLVDGDVHEASFVVKNTWKDNHRPVSSGQESLYISYLMDPAALEMNEQTCVHVYGKLDLESFQLALNQLIQRHEVFRCGFDHGPGGIEIFVSSVTEVPLKILKAGMSEDEIKVALQKECTIAFDLSSPPFLRSAIAPVAPGHNVIMILMHHILMDGWSMGKVWSEIMALYKSITTGEKLAVEELPLQYSDFAAWERRQLDPGNHEYTKLVFYWKSQLQYASPVIQLPYDYPRSSESADGGREPVVIGAMLEPEMVSKLKAVAAKLKISLYALCLAAFRLMLCEFSASDDVIISSTYSIRPPGTEDLIGYFLRMLLLRNRLEEEDTFASLAQREMDTLTGAIEHSILPLQDVISVSNLPRAPGRTPAWQASITWDEEDWMDPSAANNAAASPANGETIKMESFPISAPATTTDIALGLVPSSEGLEISLHTDGNLFAIPTVKRMLSCLAGILESAAADANAPLKDQVKLSKVALDEVMALSCGEQRSKYLSAPLIHESFENIAAATPNQRCLCFEGEWLSYGEVSQRVSQLVDYLVSSGVGPGVVVGIMMDRSFELVVSILAVFKAGGVYLPCDPSYPDDRLEVYFEDADAKIVLVQDNFLQRAASMVAAGVLVVDVAATLATVDAKEERQLSSLESVGPDDPAYIIFTSGSTGRPKGVVIPHRGVRDLMPYLVDQFKLDSNDTIIFANTINFDASIIQALPPLTIGAGLVIAKPEGHLDATYIAQLVIKHQVTGLICTVPTLAQEYVAELKRAGVGPYTQMKAWGLGGESCPAGLIREMQLLFPNIIGPVNMYGPTEVTAVTVQHVFPKEFDTVVIGKPDANVHAYIVDSELRPVPVGVPGELLLSGPRLALGYVGRPDLTEEKVISNPCLDLLSDRMNPELAPFYEKAYRTGDLVRWRNDGTIDFLGRIDRQVKITGVRIELGEVESALEGAEGVTGAIAAAIADPTGKQRLVGYVTPGGLDTAAVTAHCRALLVAAMVPTVIVSLDAFPRLPNGKVDVRALPAPGWSGDGEEEYAAPANEAETIVQRVFAEVLGRSADDLSVLADFFSAGGTSLQVFRAVALLQEAFKLASVPTTLVHNKRSAHQVAAALTDLSALGAGEDAVPFAPIPCKQWPDSMRPLSANQEQMWVLSSLAGASAYNIPSALDFFDQAPDAETLRAALNLIAVRHEVLRTLYKLHEDGSIAGRVVPASEFQVPMEVIEASSEEEIVREVAAEAARPFDLVSEPLIRAKLLLRSFSGGSGAVLALTMHHAVGDAWSQGIFWKELSTAYDAAAKGKAPEWSPLPIQYGDYAAWQREQLSGSSGEALRAFWKKTLAGAPAMLQLPQDRPRPSKPTFLAGMARFTLPDGLLGKLESVARSLRVNMQAVLLAGLQAVLLRYTGQDDLVVGIPVAGRDRQETHGLIGYFINTLPVRYIAAENATFADMVREASVATLAALDHALLPLEDVVAASGVPRVPNVNPLFQVLFQYLPDQTSADNARLGDFKYQPFKSAAGQLEHAKMDLAATLSGSTISAEFMAEMFDLTTIQRILSSFAIALEQLVENINARALAGNLSSPQDALEAAQLSMGEERPAYFSAPLVHEEFATIAQQCSQSRCLGYEGKWLNYGEVLKRVSALAERLASLGVGPGVVVGVMLDRSFELIISILAVFKAGGVYLPCDPSYPDDRLEVYLEDASAVALLTVTEYAARARAMAPSSVSVIDLNVADGLPSGNSAVAVRSPSAEDLAYIIFTSGSTGRPKGVMVPHRGLRDFVLGTREYYKVQADAVGLLTITINFDPHLMQIMPALTVGGKLIIAKPDSHTDGVYLSRLAAQEGVTHFNSTPSLALVQFGSPGGVPCPAMRYAMVGGESMPREVINLFAEKLHNCRLYNGYGPTEATISATEMYCPVDTGVITIGRPVYNLHCYIVDSELRPVPVGVPGELLLSGPRLALGYVGRPDLTEEKFITNPCLNLVSGRVDLDLATFYEKAYRTGDLVRWRNDGTIDFLGRIDRQVKITGVRIELGEVEGALESTPGVTQAVAAAVANAAGQKRLVAYVTPATVNPADVIAHCRSILVPAMVPSIVVALESFPLLPGGKINVKALPAPDWSGAGEEEYVAPKNSIEEVLQLIWMDCLDSDDPISVTADYFAIGGTSLKTGIINAAIRQQLDIQDIPGTLISTHPTIRSLAVALQNLVDDIDSLGPLLRSTTLLGRMSTIFRRQKTGSIGLIQRAEKLKAVHLSAESTRIAELMPYPVPETKLPYLVYMVVQLILCASAGAVVPALTICHVLAALLICSAAGALALILFGPLLVAGFLLSLAGVLVLGKRALFPGGMLPGIYPLYGSVYCRWVAYRALHTAIFSFLLKFIRRTKLISTLFRFLGAHIGDDVIIDSADIFEPDLIAIGHNSVLAEFSSITASFVAPAGFLDDVGCLVLSTSRVGTFCTVGRCATVQAGGRVPQGHSIRPYGTASQPKALINGDMGETYPHFYAESHLRNDGSLSSALLLYLILLPAAIATLFVFAILTYIAGLRGSNLGAALLNVLIQGSAWELLLYGLCAIIAYVAVFPRVARAVVSAAAIFYKHKVMGRLTPGMNLLSNNRLLYRYCIFKRILEFPFLSINSVAAKMGANVQPTSQYLDGISEFDAITIGAYTNSGGFTCFKCVDLEGEIHPITIASSVNSGHTTFFPGCVIEEGVQLGNETSVPMNSIVPKDHQLQGDNQFRMRKGEAKAAAPRLKKQTQRTLSDLSEGINADFDIDKGILGELIDISAIHGVSIVLLALVWARSAVWTLPMTVPVVLIATTALDAYSGIFYGLYLKRATNVFDLVQSEGTCSTTHPSYLNAYTLAIKVMEYMYPFRGTPWYNTMARLCGIDIHPGTILFAPIYLTEAHLLHLGKGVVDWGAKTVSHFTRDGKYFFKSFYMEDGAWIQANCRILSPLRVEEGARILPACTTLPNERITRETIWAGIPGGPVGQLLKPSVRNRI